MAFLRGLFSAAVLTGLASLASAQSGAPNGQVFQDWRLVCQAVAVNQTACAIAQSHSNSETQTFLGEVSLRVVNGDQGPRTVLALSTPTGMLLTVRPGFQIGGSGETLPLVWRTCNQRVCTASRVLTNEEVAAIKAGTQMIVGYRPAGQANSVNLGVSLRGVTAGLNALGG